MFSTVLACLGHKSELRRLQDVQNQRTENLKHSNRDTYTATMWLRDNKHRFKHTIHEPILLTVSGSKIIDIHTVHTG